MTRGPTLCNTTYWGKGPAELDQVLQGGHQRLYLGPMGSSLAKSCSNAWCLHRIPLPVNLLMFRPELCCLLSCEFWFFSMFGGLRAKAVTFMLCSVNIV